MGWFEHLEATLGRLVTVTQFVLEATAVFCVIAGLIKTAQLAITRSRHSRGTPYYPLNKVRIRFGTWLALALEFQLGADVLATTIAPTIEELSKLALIAVVRTFLNYFLGKELEVEYELEEKMRLALRRESTGEDQIA